VPKFIHVAAKYLAPAVARSPGLRLVFDIESDGLLDAATKVHCIVVADLDSDQVDAYGPEQTSTALAHLARADYLTGHNIVGYDLPLLRRLYGWAPSSGCTILDTLVASRLILPHAGTLDDLVKAMGGQALGRLRGGHSIEAWGARLGISKAGTDIKVFSQWSPELQERCVSDVAICKALWLFLKPDGYSVAAMALEHRVAVICDRITCDGVPFDSDAARQLHEQWTARRAKLEAQLSEQFPGTNLNSRPQIGALLEAKGWVPEERTEKTGRPKIDDELMETLPALYPEFAGLAEYWILGRRLAQLKSWRKNIGADGRIYGGIVHIGTAHGRAAHMSPNLAQVPQAKRGKPFAAECRALFQASGWAFVAADQAGLQDRGVAHCLAEFDSGAYAATFSDGTFDTHWQTGITLGLIQKGTVRDKQNKVHEVIREGAKTFRYAFLFGAGAPRAGHIVGNTVSAAAHIDPANDLRQRIFGGAAHPDKAALARVGKRMIERFVAGTPGLQPLRQSLKAQVGRRGWLLGLDRRRIPPKSGHTALNYIVSAAEAII
jgi:DNA polymerase I